MKKVFWSVVRKACAPAKNIWKRAVIEESKLKKEQEQYKAIQLNKQEEDKQKLIDSMKEFENTMNDLINKLKNGENQ